MPRDWNSIRKVIRSLASRYVNTVDTYLSPILISMFVGAPSAAEVPEWRHFSYSIVGLPSLHLPCLPMFSPSSRLWEPMASSCLKMESFLFVSLLFPIPIEAQFRGFWMVEGLEPLSSVSMMRERTLNPVRLKRSCFVLPFLFFSCGWWICILFFFIC